MPTYEFRCPDGHEFERFYRKISDATPEVACPECGKPAVRKLSGGAGLHFKGSGFYLTDYGKNAHRTSGAPTGSGDGTGGDAKSGEAKSSDAKSSDAKSGESKPAESKSGASKPSETKSSGTAGGSSSSGKATDK